MNEYSIQTLSIKGQTILLKLPSNAEAMLNLAVSGGCVDPYWGKLWDSAVDSAECVFQNEWPDGIRALELGCGAGLLGIAGQLAGMDVTFSDHEPMAVELACENSRLNGFESATGIVLDWQAPSDAEFDVLLASDVLYEDGLHVPLLDLAKKMLVSGGQFCIGDPGRQLARSFLNRACDARWKVTIYDNEMNETMTPFNNQFQWIVLKK